MEEGEIEEVPGGGCFPVEEPLQYKEQFYSGDEHEILNTCNESVMTIQMEENHIQP